MAVAECANPIWCLCLFFLRFPGCVMQSKNFLKELGKVQDSKD